MITIADGQTAGSVSVTAGNDVYVGQPAVHAHIVDASGGNFEHLVVAPGEVVTPITDTVDPTDLTLSVTPTVVEGQGVTFTATLTNAPGRM
ncbi:hypothetical protein NMD14_09380 [Aeromonas veronii]